MISKYRNPSKPYRLVDGKHYIVFLENDSFVLLKWVAGMGWKYPGTDNWETDVYQVVRSVTFEE